ncbi:MAG: hypothetical protein M3R30_00325 [Candidatus Eremiobacteraeota bacterium]|nr:hypothetical protein [Candidatus Eremiobacteraeota bacterium]
MKIRPFAAALTVAFSLSLAPAGAALNWVPFAASNDGFTALFPGAPAIAPHPTDATVDGVYRIYEVDVRSSAYTITIFRYKPGTASAGDVATYQRLRDAYAKGSGCKVASTTRRTIAGSPGLESLCLDKKGKIDHLIDIVLSGDQLAMIISAGPTGFTKDPSAIAFRNGFAFAPVVTPSPAPVAPAAHASEMPSQSTATP